MYNQIISERFEERNFECVNFCVDGNVHFLLGRRRQLSDETPAREREFQYLFSSDLRGIDGSLLNVHITGYCKTEGFKEDYLGLCRDVGEIYKGHFARVNGIETCTFHNGQAIVYPACGGRAYPVLDPLKMVNCDPIPEDGVQAFHEAFGIRKATLKEMEELA